jgi:hypothetical protein
MATNTIDQVQRGVTRLAGIMYLRTMVTANFADFYVRRQLFVPADPAQTLRNIAASWLLVRVGIGSDLITIVGSVILLVALYVILKPVNKSAALVAAFLWLLECSVAAVVALNTLAALFLLGGKDFSRAFNTYHLETLAQLFLSAPSGKSNRCSPLWAGIDTLPAASHTSTPRWM